MMETDRLILRKVGSIDYQNLLKLLNNPDVMRYSMGRMGPLETKEWLKESMSFSAHCFVISEKHRSEFIGYIRLQCQDDEEAGNFSVGYRLLPEFWNMGYGTEVLERIIMYAQEFLDAKKIRATIDPENKASIKIAEKVGMQVKGEIMLPGYDHPDLVYEIETPNQGGNKKDDSL